MQLRSISGSLHENNKRRLISYQDRSGDGNPNAEPEDVRISVGGPAQMILQRYTKSDP